MRSLIAGLGVLTIVLSASGARAAEPTKAECLSANTEAQTLRREKKLRASRAALHVCVSAVCPGAVRDDCTQRLDELERLLPTIVFEVKDGAGRDLSAVKVTMDGEMIAEKLDGTALAADPGEHAFVFEVAGQPPVTQRLVVREGDRGRRERVTIATASSEIAKPPVVAPEPATPTLPPDTAPPTSERPSGSSGSGQRIAGLVIGGVGLVGIGLGAVFGASASSSWSSAQSECSAGPGNCPNRAQALVDHDSATSSGTLSTIAFIAGGALVAGGLVLFFTAPSGHRAPTSSARVRVVPSVGPGGGGMILRGSF